MNVKTVDRKQVLQAFSRALGHETHVLKHRPDLLWQQMHNALRPVKISDIQLHLEAEANKRNLVPWLKKRGGVGVPAMRVLASFESGIESCDWSNTASLIGLGCRDGSVHILVPNTGETTMLSEHEGPVTCCRFTPDGLFLISGSNDSTLKVFNISTRKQCGEFTDHQSPVTCLVVLPEGRMVVSGSQDRTLIVWDIDKLKSIKTLSGHDRGVLCNCLSVDGRWLASGDTAGKLVLWNMQTFEQLRSFYAHDDAVLCCAFNLNCDLLATGAADASASIWQLNDSSPPVELVGHTDEVAGCEFVSENLLVTVNADQSIRTWDIKTGSAVAGARGQNGPITCLSMHSDAIIAYTGATNGSVVAWFVPDLGDVATTRGHGAAVTGVVANSRGFLATSSLDGTAIIWRISDGSILHQLLCEEPLIGCALRREGSTLITSSSNKLLIEWEILSGMQLRSIPVGLDIITCCASDSEQDILVLGTMEGLLVVKPDSSLWRYTLKIDTSVKADLAYVKEALQSSELTVDTKRYVRKASREYNSNMPKYNHIAAQCVALQPGGRLIAVGDVLGRVTLVDLRTYSVVNVLPAFTTETTTSAMAVALAPNYKHLAVGYSDGMVAVYSLEGSISTQWPEQGGILACAFSSDSQLLAIGTENKYLSVWDWREQTEVYHLPMNHTVRACAFVENEPVVACTDSGGDVCIVEMIGRTFSFVQSQRLEKK